MQFSNQEEVANTISHGLGFVFGLVALPFLNSDISFIVYGFCFLLLFFSSTIYHGVQNLRLKQHLQKLDHVSIYFMIAGSYTPFIFGCLDGILAWSFFGLMWFIVLLGTVFKIFYTGKFERLSLILYLAMGWMVIFISRSFFSTFDSDTIWLVVIGGLFYTIGVYFYANDHKKFFHLIWHIFVLGGAISHYWAIASI